MFNPELKINSITTEAGVLDSHVIVTFFLVGTLAHIAINIPYNWLDLFLFVKHLSKMCINSSIPSAFLIQASSMFRHT